MIELVLAVPALSLLISLVTDVVYMSYVQLAASIFVFIAVIQSVMGLKSDKIFLGGYFFLDHLNAVILFTVSLLELFIAFYSFGYIRTEIKHGLSKRKFKFYYFWKNLFVLSMMVSILANNLGIFWIGIEGTTLATALLVSFNRTKEAYEATWKYVMMCSVGIALGLFAIVILYFTTSSAYGQSIKALSFLEIVKIGGSLDRNFVLLSFILALTGFGTKVGLAPMHNWLPDAHSQAPSPISALLSGVLLNTALLGILRFYQIAVSSGISYARYFFIGFGFLTIVVSAVSIFSQKDYKRLFAYSSMENMGLITLGFGTGGVAVLGSILQILFHALNKGAIFLSSGNVLAVTHERKIKKLKNLSGIMPVTAFMLLLGTIGITGTPPFSMFLSELFIMIGLFSFNPVFAFVVLFFLVLVFAGLLSKILSMYGNAQDEKKHAMESSLHPFLIYIPAALILVSVALLFYIPNPLLVLIKSAVAELGGGIA